MKTLLNSLCFFGLLLVLATACDSARVYQEYNDLEQLFWHVDSVQRFDFEIEDTDLNYNLLATFRNDASYPYYNLYFQYVLLDSLDTLKKQLTEVNLFDPKSGEPLGDGLGNLFDHQAMLEENITFEKAGTYSLTLQHFMRLDTLPLIMSVGARVEKVEE